jgi:hypothetical protein
MFPRKSQGLTKVDAFVLLVTPDDKGNLVYYFFKMKLKRVEESYTKSVLTPMKGSLLFYLMPVQFPLL